MTKLTENTANGAKITPVTIDYRIPMGELIKSCNFEYNVLDEVTKDLRFNAQETGDKKTEKANLIVEDDCYWSWTSSKPSFFRHRHPSNRNTHPAIEFENVRAATLREYFSLISQNQEMQRTTPLVTTQSIYGQGGADYRYYPLAGVCAKDETPRGLFGISGDSLTERIGKVFLVGRVTD